MELDSAFRITAEITVSKQVRAAFINKLWADLDGYFDRDDKARIGKVMDDVQQHDPVDWLDETKREFLYFIEACAEVYAEEHGSAEDESER